MDSATFQVGMHLDRAAADLTTVGHQLEAHFNHQFRDLPQSQHPHALLERVRKLVEQLPQLTADCELIHEAKSQLQTATAEKMAANLQTIRQLQQLAGDSSQPSQPQQPQQPQPA